MCSSGNTEHRCRKRSRLAPYRWEGSGGETIRKHVTTVSPCWLVFWLETELRKMGFIVELSLKVITIEWKMIRRECFLDSKLPFDPTLCESLKIPSRGSRLCDIWNGFKTLLINRKKEKVTMTEWHKGIAIWEYERQETLQFRRKRPCRSQACLPAWKPLSPSLEPCCSLFIPAALNEFITLWGSALPKCNVLPPLSVWRASIESTFIILTFRWSQRGASFRAFSADFCASPRSEKMSFFSFSF